MFGNGQLTRCQQRKGALLQRSATHRRLLATDAQALRAVAAWMDLGIDVARKGRTGWSVLAPLFSLWQRRKQEPSGFAQKFSGAIALARSLAALWKNWR